MTISRETGGDPATTAEPLHGAGSGAEEDAGAGIKERLRQRLRVFGQGEIGSLPVVLGIIIIWAIFFYQEPRFLSPVNLTNLMLQIAAVGTIAVGVVLVLLLGEIDLSVGAVSGLCAAVMAVFNVKQGVSAPLAILSGIAAGAAIGLFQGLWITRFKIPSFVVTLAGLLAWTGLLLRVLGPTGTVNLRDPGITRLAGTFLPPALGWALGIFLIAAFVARRLLLRRRRAAAGLPLASLGSVAAELVLPAAVVAAAVTVLNADRGVPLAVVILVGLVLLFDVVTRKTRFGRHIYAVGGNAEAARRAGIHVDGVRVAVFTLASMLAAAGGIMGASRLLAVNQSSGSGDLLLNSIAAAVIGGTSLFGGRGTAWSALLGALVIGSVSNGMDLLGFASAVKFMVTGAVLLIAVTIDATARRGRLAAGRA